VPTCIMYVNGVAPVYTLLCEQVHQHACAPSTWRGDLEQLGFGIIRVIGVIRVIRFIRVVRVINY
jgi:hypothetical protein